jgi:hypothetical protein
MDNVMDHYQAVLSDLELRRSRCQKELADLEQTIAGIRKLLASSASLFVGTPITSRTAEPSSNPEEKYANMSQRWAILKFLAEDATGPMKAAEIAIALLNGGVRSNGKDFAGNVSAVISTMKAKGEVEQAEDGGHRLTDNGRLAWAAIKHSPKYVNRGAVSATLQ